jgi:hypothetical protein
MNHPKNERCENSKERWKSDLLQKKGRAAFKFERKQL